MTTSPPLTLYNGAIEHAGRLIILLEVFHPHRLSVEEIRVLAHLCVYGEDVGYKSSLQRRVEGRAAAFHFREEVVLDAMQFLLAGGLVEGCPERGYRVTSNERWAYGLSQYSDEVFDVCCHMRDRADEAGIREYIAVLKADIEARSKEPPGDMPEDPQFLIYEEIQFKDMARMGGLWMAIYQFKENLELKAGDHPCLNRGWLEQLSKEVEKEELACRGRIVTLRKMRDDGLAM
jgi:hypothetical protein